MASFAHEVSRHVTAVLREAEAAGRHGETKSALELLRSTAEQLPLEADDDRVAIGELAVLIAAWAGRIVEYSSFFQSLANAVQSPQARGALLFYQGRTATGRHATQLLNEALSEFALAGDRRGQAVTLGELCWMREDGVSAEYRVRLGVEALALAEKLRDPWAIAFCCGRLAGTETYLGRPEALQRWADAARAFPIGADPLTFEIASLNQSNWAHTAYQHGDYELASRVANEGRVLAHGAGWSRKFDALQALVDWRTGNLEAVQSHARPRKAGDMEPVAAIAVAAVDYERSPKLTTSRIDEALTQLPFDHQMTWIARAVQADIRVARHEPRPLRDLSGVVDQACRLDIRFGWEDAVLTMARHRPTMARNALDRLNDRWPAYRRAELVRRFVEGLIAEHRGYDLLREAGEGFAAIGEKITAGQAWHAAARVAPDVKAGNALRARAVGQFRECGADRSLAAVLRERRLHRGEGHVPIPASQRYVETAALTAREREVASYAARGWTADEIAAELHISVGTARNHLLKVREKFGGIPKRRLSEILGAHNDDRP